MTSSVSIFQVDAFADQLFAGNPAAVCPLDSWLSDQEMQAIAAENNLAETAFFVPTANGFHLRWFTPAYEMDLCGHATLASAHVLFTQLGYMAEAIEFETRSGLLTVIRKGDKYQMDFPSRPPLAAESPSALIEGLGGKPIWTGLSRDYLVEFETEAEVAALQPRMDLLATLPVVGVIATARSTNWDFVSRFFAPQAGVPEDPVTGSAHCSLVPYWAGKLNKTELVARQISARAGTLWCQLEGERVFMSGTAHTFLKGHIFLPAAL